MPSFSHEICILAFTKRPNNGNSIFATFALLLLLGFLSQARASEADTLAKQAVARAWGGERAAFANDYLREAFSAWQQASPRTFAVDSIYRGSEIDEIWLLVAPEKKSRSDRLRMLVARSPEYKVIEIRCLLFETLASMPATDRAIAAFVEQFAWLYETGNNSFVEDLFYPEYVKIQYAGMREIKTVLQRLRKQFGTALPVKTVNWERQENWATIQLVLESPLRPLEIALQIDKYLTANFFGMSNRSRRIQALKQRLQGLLQIPIAPAESEALIVNATSARPAADSVLQQYFADYQILVLKEGPASLDFEARLAPLYQFTPLPLSFQLRAIRYRQDEFQMTARFLDQASVPDSSFLAALLEKESLLSLTEAKKIVMRVHRRYSTLHLPAIFQRQEPGAHFLRAQIIIDPFDADTLEIGQNDRYLQMLRELAHDKISYFFLRDLKAEQNALFVTGYAIWVERHRWLRHVAAIQERYGREKGEWHLQQALVALYPLIRTDYVGALLAKSKPQKNGRKTIQVRR